MLPDPDDLGREIARALRHEPGRFRIALDREGFADIATLLASLRALRAEWASLDRAHLISIATAHDRHEVRDDHIRARYGHTVPLEPPRASAPPPRWLFHAAPPGALDPRDGAVRPHALRHVHLWTESASAFRHGARFARTPTLLAVRAADAHAAGVPLYEGNARVWLAPRVPAEFVQRSADALAATAIALDTRDEVTAEVSVHVIPATGVSLAFQGKLELTVDCWICGHTQRTMSVTRVPAWSRCTSSGHAFPVSITALDADAVTGRARYTVRYPFAPFTDPKHGDDAIPVRAWARVHWTAHCPRCSASVEGSTQSNLVRPYVRACTCGAPLWTDRVGPAIARIG